VQLPAPVKELARLYSGLASDRRRNCTRRHRGCKDALLLGSRPSPALPNQSHYLVFSLITGRWSPQGRAIISRSLQRCPDQRAVLDFRHRSAFAEHTSLGGFVSACEQPHSQSGSETPAPPPASLPRFLHLRAGLTLPLRAHPVLEHMLSHKPRGLLSGANKGGSTTQDANRWFNGKVCHAETTSG
jgi:hypothetical protein